MRGTMRSMHQGNMVPPHQQHMHRNRQPPHGQILSMPTHQPPPQHMHHMQHPPMQQHNNPRQMLGMNAMNVCVLLLMILIGTEAKKYPSLYSLLENVVLDDIYLEDIFGPTGCVEGMVNVGIKEQNPMPVTLNLNPSTMQAQQQQPPIQQQIIEQSEDDGNDVNLANQNVNGTNSNLANMKEKTPMCLVNELARFNKIQHQYRLTDEQGPAHKKRFTVTLKLGEEDYVAEGPSIKKAQHTAASEALSKTWYRQPPPKPLRTMRAPGKCPAGSGHLPPTVELNALAMKRGEPTIYTFKHAPPTAGVQQFIPANYGTYPRMFNPRCPPYNRGFHAEPQGFYLVSLKVGECEFVGRGVTGQAARHDAASRALEHLRQLPLPEMTSETYQTSDNGTMSGIDDPNAELKSPVSLVHETALKRGLPVIFEVVSESGKPHIRTFKTKCIVGEEFTVGEGSSKKVSKKRAAELMLEKLKRLPPISVSSLQNGNMRVKRKPPATKKKTRNLIKPFQESRTESEVVEEVNPISRLVQIQQSKREKEPDYNLIDEKGAPRRREFVMEVTVGQFSAQGIGPTKKLAKRAAAEALLTLMGYSKPQPQPVKPSIKTSDKESNEVKPRKVTFLEDDDQASESQQIQNHTTGSTIGRQLVPGVLLVDSGQVSSGPSLQSVAEELRGQQKKQKSSSTVSPKEQLKYLAQLLNFDVQFSDFPKGLYKEYLSLVSLSTDPPQVCHGHGATTDASRDHAALTALRTLSKLGLDNVTSAQNKKDKAPAPESGNSILTGNQIKTNLINGAIDK